jgi:lipopolysaccharide heptosyltransferase II
MTGYAWYAISALATALHRKHWKPGTLRRILIVKTDHLGDFLLCLPAVRDFLAAEPSAEIGFVVGSPTRELAERVSWIRETHIFDSPRYVRIGRPSPEGTLESILARDWDLIIDLTNDRASALAALARPSRHRRDVGTYRMKQKLGILAGRTDSRDRHISRVFYRALGLHPPEIIVPVGLDLRPEDRAVARAALARAWPGDRAIAALHAGATWSFRRWPAGRFAETAKRLEADGFSVIFVGGPDDREISLEIARAAGIPEARVLAGHLGLPAAAAVLESCALVVANDGGVLHLAAAMGTPVIGLYGPNEPGLFGPIGAKSIALYHKRDCSPCSQRHCIWGRSRCLEPIEIADVTAAALRAAKTR